MIGGAARCRGAGVLAGRRGAVLEHRERVRREGQGAHHVRAVLDDHKTVLSELQGLRLRSGPSRRRAFEAVRAASGHAAVLVQELAGNVEDGVDVQIAIALPELEEGDPGGMAQ